MVQALNTNLPKLNILVAYPYFTKELIKLIAGFEEKYPGVMRLFVDSGAFTAHTTGKVITLDDYCNFINKLPVKPWRYFALDVIGNEVKTISNLKEMYNRGLKPVPVYTFNQDPEDIEYYYTLNDFIGYGGLVGQKQSATVKHGIDKVLRIANGRKVHLLGYTSMPWIKKFKPYSCDSSSYSSAQRYGDISLYMGNGIMKKLDRKSIQTKPNEIILSKIKSLGYKPSDLTDKEQWKGGKSIITRLTTSSWVKMSHECEKYIGTKIFLAVVPSTCKTVLNCYERLIRR